MSEVLNMPFEIKALSAREFEGHGSVFGNVDLGGDIVMPGAFARTLAQHKANGVLPQMFWMHRMDMVPGKWLEMSEDARGLKVKGVLAKTQLGDEMHTLMKMDAVRGLSIGFFTRDQDFDTDGNRLIKEVELIETSVVSLAMNPLAEVESVKARLSNAGEYVPAPREIEAHFRNLGCSKTVARQLVHKVFEGSGGMLDNSGGMLNEDEEDMDRLKQALLQRHGMDRSAESLFD